jgi:hypothetical protein
LLAQQAIGNVMNRPVAANRDDMLRALSGRLLGNGRTVTGSFGTGQLDRPPVCAEFAEHEVLDTLTASAAGGGVEDNMRVNQVRRESGLRRTWWGGR